jgi:hypothetical protein
MLRVIAAERSCNAIFHARRCTRRRIVLSEPYLGREIAYHEIHDGEPEESLPGIGYCIYCEKERDPANLTREHIVAANMGGQLVMEQASCRACASITGSKEQLTLRNEFNLVRAVHGLRKRKRPDALRETGITTIRAGERDRHIVKIEENPPYIIPLFTTFGLPGILYGMSPA